MAAFPLETVRNDPLIYPHRMLNINVIRPLSLTNRRMDSLAQGTLYRYRFLEQKQVSVLLSLEEPTYGITWMTTLSNARLSHRLNVHLETRY